ncbi:MAG TPA: hypothetical protein VMJ30_03425, partial [Gemmatimonadales bacterium]|nr:hypothetical protein [Gemmatimonadales bacterium]
MMARAASVRNLSTWGEALVVSILLLAGPASAADRLAGQVLGGGAPIAKSTVTLWAASAGDPKQLAQAQTNADGRFELSPSAAPGKDAILYLVAKGGQPAANKKSGDNPAIALLAVLGGNPPPEVVINELTTIASVWTNAQFLDGTALKGHALGLKIAAGNVPNFVDLATGGWGGTIQDPLNSSQTPTMANFATLADVLSGCVTQVTPDACSKLFAASTPPTGVAPTDTLTAAESIARYPWYQPERLFALLDELYAIPKGKTMRAVPYMPYLKFAPSAWVLPLKVTGGGFRAGGKAMFDSEGNLWVGDNFTVGWQGQDDLWQGNATKFAPNGRPLSPMTTGFAGGGMQGGTFGCAVDTKDNAWLTSYGGKSIAVFDKNGKPLTPPDGITFDGKLGLMQGVIVTPSGDVWVLGLEKRQLVFFPKGDLTKGKLLCEGDAAEPCKSFKLPFHLGIDQQDRIWVTNGGGDFVVRFPAGDPSKVEKFHAGFSGSGLGIDSQGNVWVTNRFGNGVHGLERMAKLGVVMLLGGSVDRSLAYTMFDQKGG